MPGFVGEGVEVVRVRVLRGMGVGEGIVGRDDWRL